MRTGRPLSRAAQRITDLLISISDWFFPPQCLICGKHSGFTPFLCEECLKKCHCLGEDPDPACKHEDRSAEIICSMYRFDEQIQNLIHHLKYRDMPFIGDLLGRLAGDYFSGSPVADCDVLIPVPLYRTRRRERTYNQSFHIAKGIGKVWDVPVRKKLLLRRRDTGTQTKLNRKERRENIRNAFEVRKNREIPFSACIVDDVFTTGATCREAARSLKRAGVKKVYILTLAAAMKDQ